MEVFAIRDKVNPSNPYINGVHHASSMWDSAQEAQQVLDESDGGSDWEVYSYRFLDLQAQGDNSPLDRVARARKLVDKEDEYMELKAMGEAIRKIWDCFSAQSAARVDLALQYFLKNLGLYRLGLLFGKDPMSQEDARHLGEAGRWANAYLEGVIRVNSPGLLR